MPFNYTKKFQSRSLQFSDNDKKDNVGINK